MLQKLCIYLGYLKVTSLAGLVMASFALSSLLWRLIDTSDSIKCLVAGIILLIVYLLLLFEMVNRTLAALIGAALAIGAHNCLLRSVSLEEAVSWEDLDTLALLFGMMIIVNVLNYSGLFDYLAVACYKHSNGHFWCMVTFMVFVTGILSALIDNVSCMLLMTPTLIRLSELEQIDPRNLLMVMILSANIGGCATPIGDPPNLIVIGSHLASETIHLSFGTFTAIAAPAALLCMIVMLIYLKLRYKSRNGFSDRISELQDMQLDERLQQLAIELTSRVDGNTISVGSLEETNSPTRWDSVTGLRIRRKKQSRLSDLEIEELMQTHGIKSWPVLIMSLTVLFTAIVLFFLQSVPGTNLTLGWTSLYAGLTLLILTSGLDIRSNSDNDQDSDNDQETSDLFEAIINNIEWSTLIFFSSLFIIMEVMTRLGLIFYMSEKVTDMIDLLPADGRWRSIGALTIILWSSAIASAFVDNIPFTSMMIKVLEAIILDQRRRSEQELSSHLLNLTGLVMALVLGACLGGNGSLIGASCNLVTANISGRYGYPITFNRYLQFAAPITILTVAISNIYLVLIFEFVEF